MTHVALPLGNRLLPRMCRTSCLGGKRILGRLAQTARPRHVRSTVQNVTAGTNLRTLSGAGVEGEPSFIVTLELSRCMGSVILTRTKMFTKSCVTRWWKQQKPMHFGDLALSSTHREPGKA